MTRATRHFRATLRAQYVAAEYARRYPADGTMVPHVAQKSPAPAHSAQGGLTIIRRKAQP